MVAQNQSHQHQPSWEAGAASAVVSAAEIVVGIVAASVAAEAASAVEEAVVTAAVDSAAERTLGVEAGEVMAVVDSGQWILNITDSTLSLTRFFLAVVAAAEVLAIKAAASTIMAPMDTEGLEVLEVLEVPVVPVDLAVIPVDQVGMGLQGVVTAEDLAVPVVPVGMARQAEGTVVVGIAETSSATAALVGLMTVRQNALDISLTCSSGLETPNTQSRDVDSLLLS